MPVRARGTWPPAVNHSGVVVLCFCERLVGQCDSLNFTHDAAGEGECPAGRSATTRGHHSGRQAASLFRCV